MKVAVTSMGRRRPSMAVDSRWIVNGDMSSGSSTDNSADDYEEPHSSSAGPHGRTRVPRGGDPSGAAPRQPAHHHHHDGGMAGDGSAEPGKYNFQLLPEHCIRGRQGNKMYKCDICGGCYRHAFSLKRHYLRNHINHEYLSQSDIANCNINMELHHRSSGGGGRSDASSFRGVYRCNICTQLFDRVASLKDHVTNHPNVLSSKRFSCTQCDMTFSHKQNLVRHMSVHSGEKPFACRHCGKGFPTATNQRRHERIHQGLKPYVCVHCQSHFSQSGDLKKHIRKLHGEFFHQCAFCMKYFARRSELQDHVVSHGKSLELNHKVLKHKVENNSSGGGCTGGGNSSSSSSCCSAVASSSMAAAAVEERSPPVRKTAPALSAAKVFPLLNYSELPRRYRCSLCNKRFFTNVKLQRHRSIAHPPRRATAEPHAATTALTVPRRVPRRSSPMQNVVAYDSGRFFSDPSPYFANVSKNIAHNLQYYLDGKLAQRKQEGGIRKIGGVTAPALPASSVADLPWSDYNFPPDFGHIKSQEAIVAASSYVEEPHPVIWCAAGGGGSVADSLNSSGNSPVVSESEMTNGCADVLDLSMSKVVIENAFCPPPDKSEAMFAKPATMFLCHACGECFPSVVEIEEHKVNNHPNVYCTHVEVEDLKDVPLDLLRYQCSPEGALLCCPAPPLVCSISSSLRPRCTKCSETFQTSGDLHEHILVCGGHVDRRSCGQGSMTTPRRVRLSKRVVKRGMKRRLEMADDPQHALPKRRIRKTRKEPGWDWLPPEQPDVKPVERVVVVPAVVTTCSAATSVPDARTSRPAVVPSEVRLMCDGCNQKFKYVSALERHQKVCVNEAAHRGQNAARETRHQRHCCPYCSRSFTYPASLKKHISGFCVYKESVKTKEKTRTPKRGEAAAAQAGRETASVASPPPLDKSVPSPAVVTIGMPAEDGASKEEEDRGDLEMDDGGGRAELEEIVATSGDGNDEQSITDAIIKEEATEGRLAIASPPLPAPADEAPAVEDLPAIKREARSVGTSPCRLTQHSEPRDSIKTDEKILKTEELPPPHPRPPSSPPHSKSVIELRDDARSSPGLKSVPPPVIPSPDGGALSKDVAVKVELAGGGGAGSGGQAKRSATPVEQHHQCPNCKRTFTYVANFKKHLNVLCPLRSAGPPAGGHADGGSDKQKSKLAVPDGGGSSDGKTDDPIGGALQKPAADCEPSSHECSICHKSFKEYVEMLKHRIFHKLTTTSSGKGDVVAAVNGNEPDAKKDDVGPAAVTARRDSTSSSSSIASSSDEPLSSCINGQLSEALTGATVKRSEAKVSGRRDSSGSSSDEPLVRRPPPLLRCATKPQKTNAGRFLFKLSAVKRGGRLRGVTSEGCLEDDEDSEDVDGDLEKQKLSNP